MTVKSFFDWLLINPEYTLMANIITNFILALVLSSTQFGIIYWIFFTLLYEIAVLYLSKGLPPYGSPFFRIAYITAGLLGFIIGRSIAFNFTVSPLENSALPEEPDLE